MSYKDQTFGEEFKVEIRSDKSLNQILAYQDEGGSVTRTPHVGNQSLAHMLYYQSGGMGLLYDRTYGGRDYRFSPDGIIANGTYTQIADSQTLMTHAQTTGDFNTLPYPVSQGVSVAALHTDALREAIPQANVVHFSRYFEDSASVVYAIARAAYSAAPHLWTRYATRNGTEQQVQVEDAQVLDRLGLLGVTELDRGLILPNQVNIIANAVIEALRVNSEVIHLSGPDMFKYIKDISEEIDYLYGHVRRGLLQHTDIVLPDTLRFRLYPVDKLRFATLPSRKAVLDSMIDTYVQYRELEDNRNTFMRSNPSKEERDAYIQNFTLRKGEHLTAMIAAVQACPEVFFDTKQKNYFTHYDLLASGEQGLYVHPWGTTESIDAVAKGFDFMSDLLTKEKA
jgi:hypothetical protein